MSTCCARLMFSIYHENISALWRTYSRHKYYGGRFLNSSILTHVLFVIGSAAIRSEKKYCRGGMIPHHFSKVPDHVVPR